MVLRHKSLLHQWDFNKQRGHGDGLSVTMSSWLARVPPVYFAETIYKYLSLRCRVGNGLAIAVLQSDDLSRTADARYTPP